ncbi:hypothetical protein HAP48_0010955 [Bradyrhizobium septentrionale]|uniref:Uncharacterized protein n=1 Tax=Bradyrhizobium septentrionale TaxID=1404411 RepID=A0A973W7Z0_9BRAD|nr:hypothetical protein [Bradyrhizobium septentrionale]UGY17898.1 hypothetical protein HAP48_0010955 [Bradyrhizobium septentrionale]
MKKTKPHNSLGPGPFPLHRGPFLFAPRFLSKGDWFREFKALIKETARNLRIEARVHDKGYADRMALIEFDCCEVAVDGIGGLFYLCERGYHDQEDFVPKVWGGLLAPPDRFLEKLTDRQVASFLKSGHEEINTFCNALIRKMKMSFQRALQEGIAVVTCHLGGLNSPREPLDYRLLRRMKIKPINRESYLDEDLELDDALTEDGHRVYELGVSPSTISGTSAATQKTGPSKAGRRRQFDRDEIKRIMNELIKQRGHPRSDRPNWTVATFLEGVKSRMSGDVPASRWLRKLYNELILNQK